MTEPVPERSLIRLPLDQFQPYPGLTARFDEDLDGLMESIRANGQRDPGKAVRRKDGGYWVYDGRRRLTCCKKLQMLYGMPSTYEALILENWTEEEVYITSVVSNESGRNERKNLSLLEEISLFYDMAHKFGDSRAVQLGVDAGKNRQTVTRLVALGRTLAPKLPSLNEIEKRSEYQFKMSHLEGLVPYKNDDEDQTFYKLAAISSERRISPAQVDVGTLNEVIEYYVPWFGHVFPAPAGSSSRGTSSNDPAQIAGDASSEMHFGEAGTEWSQEGLSGEEGRINHPGEAVRDDVDEEAARSSKVRDLDEEQGQRVFAEDIYLATCRNCGAANPFQMRTEAPPRITFIVPKKNGHPQKETASPITIHRLVHICMECGKPFLLVVSQEGPRKLGVLSYKRNRAKEEEDDDDDGGNANLHKSVSQSGVLVWDTSNISPSKENPGWIYVSPNTKRRFQNGKLLPMERVG